MLSERSFNILKKVTADWDELDKLVSDILAADTAGEVNNICISYLSISKEGILNDNFTLIVSGAKILSYLEDTVSFRNLIEYTRDDMLPAHAIYLYSRS